MQRGGERAGLEGTISLWGTRHTGVSSAPFRERRRDRFRDSKQRLLSFAFESQDFCCAENLIFLAVTSAFRLDNLRDTPPSRVPARAARPVVQVRGAW